jgi:RNA polymerase sigma-32 factor
MQSFKRLSTTIRKSFSKWPKGILNIIRQEACLGLLKAVKAFDASKNVKFLTYARWKIMREMQYFLYKYRIMRCVDYNSRLRSSVSDVMDIMNTNSLDRQEKREHFAFKKNVSVEEVEQMEKLISQQPSHKEYNFNRIKKNDNVNDNFVADLQALSKEIEKALSLLTDKQALVIKKMYWDDETNRADIGRELSLTRERIRQLEIASYEKIKKSLKNKKVVQELLA